MERGRAPRLLRPLVSALEPKAHCRGEGHEETGEGRPLPTG